MADLTTADVAGLFQALAKRMQAERDELCRLDGLIGDADHGIAMSTGMAAAAAVVAASEGTITDQFNAAAKGFLNAVGASTGPLYATALMRAGKLSAGRTTMPLADAPQIIVAMAEGIAHRGKAEPGQKTMLDAWAPAAAAAPQGLAAMAGAAEAGAEATKAMQATLGRAARLGERSIGHPDPGAVSAAIIIRVMADRWLAAEGRGA